MIQEAAGLLLRGVPFEEIKEISEDKYSQIIELTPYLQSFNLFQMCKNIGVNFSPSDLTIDQVFIFNEIQNVMTEYFKGKK